MAAETEYCDWVLRTCMKPEAWAAWTQAVFSVVAIAVAFYVAHRDSRQRSLDAKASRLAGRRAVRFALHRAATLTEQLLVHSSSAATAQMLFSRYPLAAYQDAYQALTGVAIDDLRTEEEVEAYFGARAAFVEVLHRVESIDYQLHGDLRIVTMPSEDRTETLRVQIASAAEMLM